MTGPAAHASRNAMPSRPRTSMRSSDPVIASNPVANTIASTSYAASPTCTACSVIASIGVLLTSTRCTCGWLNVS